MNAAQRYGFRVRHFPHTNAYRSAVRLGGVCTAIAGLLFAPIIGANASIFSLSGLSPDGLPRSHFVEQIHVTPSRNTQAMRRKTPTGSAHLPGAAILQIATGETVHIGPDVQVHLTRTADGRAELSIWAPRNHRIDRSKNFRPNEKSDGQGAPTPQPSCQAVPSSTKNQE